MPRDEFSAVTKKALAQRAGYLCSICNTLTIGPSDESDSSINLTGVAAHITAAAPGPGSRRYDSNLSPEQRTSINNGIWLCTTHADLIDGDETTFTTNDLKRIKENHEQKTQYRQSGLSVEKGVITKVELCNFGPIKDPISFSFGDRNIIYGNNGSGKTMIFELISSLSDKNHLRRWNNHRTKVNSFINIFYFKQQEDKFSISIDRENRTTYSFNDSMIPFLVPPMTIFFLKKSFSDFKHSLDEKKRELPTPHLISQYFNLTNDEFANVIGRMTRNKKFFFNDIDLNDQKDDLLIRLSGREFDRSFDKLSGGEKDRAVLEIALKIASYYSMFNSTILLIEQNAFANIDVKGINKLFDIIRNERPSFQFFFSSLPNNEHKIDEFNITNLR